ncbi:hypothetical protein Tco_0241324 [Tanacetum coccineum]|uniref:Reverse transcriptase domain-containing protein n=1 Tax=Tanacetum coccineum TaxID=301880 RepID=A0ABQ5HZE0_9ASTR
MDDNRTMAQLLEAPTEGYEDAIVVPELTQTSLRTKHGLLNLVQNKQFFGHDKEDDNAHIPIISTRSLHDLKLPEHTRWNLDKSLRMAKIIETKSKVRNYTKANPLLLNENSTSPPVNQPPAYQAPVYQAPAPQTQVCEDRFDCYVKANDAVMRNVQNQGQNLQAQLNNLATSNQRLESITTRSGVAYQGPAIPSTLSSPPKVMNRDTEVTKDTMLPTNNGSTEDVQPPVIQVQSQNLTSKPDVDPDSAPMPNQRTSIPFPSRRNDERRPRKG